MSVNTTKTEEPVDSAPSVSGAEKRERLSRLGQMKGIFNKMDKVSIRTQEDTRVQINGYVFKIKGKTRVMVPELVAEVLEQSGRI